MEIATYNCCKCKTLLNVPVDCKICVRCGVIREKESFTVDRYMKSTKKQQVKTYKTCNKCRSVNIKLRLKLKAEKAEIAENLI